MIFITDKTIRALKSELRAHATAYTRSHVALLSFGQKVLVRGSVWPDDGGFTDSALDPASDRSYICILHGSGLGGWG